MAKILIVDDEPTSREGMRLLLARRRAQLLLGAARFLDAQPAESLRSHPTPLRCAVERDR